MLWNASGIQGYAINAIDGSIGTVADFLFSDESWRIRWLVVDTGNWLSGRKVLIHPSALGEPDAEQHLFPVRLTMEQVKNSPDIDTDQPVSAQMEAHIYDHYQWDANWGDVNALSGLMLPVTGAPPHVPSPAFERQKAISLGDHHLRSASAIAGYHLHASDGDIGHIDDFLVADAGWTIQFIKVETSNWWVGKTVLVSPRSIKSIDWSERLVSVGLTRQQVKDSPPYHNAETVDGAFNEMAMMYSSVNWIAPL